MSAAEQSLPSTGFVMPPRREPVRRKFPAPGTDAYKTWRHEVTKRARVEREAVEEVERRAQERRRLSAALEACWAKEEAEQSAVADLVAKIGAHPATLILREVAKKHGLAIVDLKSRSRKQPIVFARQEAMYRIRHETGLSYPQIGRRLGGRDHTTVLHGVSAHQARMAREAAR